MFFLHWNSRGFPGTSYDAGRLFGAILGPFFWFFIARAVFKAGLARSAHPADPGVANQEAKGEVAKVHLPIDILIKNLNGEIPQYVVREYLPKEAAYGQLKELTGQDFGMDAKKWKSWHKGQKQA